MAVPFKGLKRLFRIRTHTYGDRRQSYATIRPDQLLEEETLPYYEPDHFYPVNIGDVLNNRYHVAGKLGYGAYSTSWLCRDTRTKKFVTVKVSTYLPKFPTATDREFRVYEHLSTVRSTHPGQSLIRECWDSFELLSNAGKHRCLALQPMHMSVLEMMKMNSKPFGLPLLKMTLTRLLTALDFLHTEAATVHTDLKTDNVMLSIHDDAMLQDFADHEMTQPTARKTIDHKRTIYQSQRLRLPARDRGYGLPTLCDFGEARIGKTHASGPFVQPHIYRAPEVIFEMRWDSAIDIWNLGALTWDLFEGDHLFKDIFDTAGKHDPFKHLALMVALIGPPPREFVQRSETTSQCFDKEGAWIAFEDAVLPTITLEEIESRLCGQEQEQFLTFLRSMLQWMPEHRKTARQLLDDPWLH